MSSIQRPTRRLSARFQAKEDATSHSSQPQPNIFVKTTAVSSRAAAAQVSKANGKKRKMSEFAHEHMENADKLADVWIIDYDEEDDGFMFKRVKKKPETRPTEPPPNAAPARPNAQEPQQPQLGNAEVPRDDDSAQGPKERRKRMSFSSPPREGDLPPRRSKRLSKDNAQADESPPKRPMRKDSSMKPRTSHPEIRSKESPKRTVHKSPLKQREQRRATSPKKSPKKSVQAQPKEKADEQRSENVQNDHQTETVPTLQESHAATRITLPMADTPVIKRNKAMREGKSDKGERRSSLGSRGRRASSLIESGTSNASPHSEVEVTEYYKHIEGEGLPEPRRMRQLLTWCAERAMDEKPIGTEFEHSSARQAARVIEEELLRDLSNKSELSDWFTREDIPAPIQPLPERPNPKNMQNHDKISELEEQIKRLRIEKQALESFLQPPRLPPPQRPRSPSQIDRSLLYEAHAAALDSISSSSNPTSTDRIACRVNEMLESIGPTIDRFADSVHRTDQYRTAADTVAGRVLAICAEKLTDREKEGRKKALAAVDQTQHQDTPPKNMASVLRSLSRADR